MNAKKEWRKARKDGESMKQYARRSKSKAMLAWLNNKKGASSKDFKERPKTLTK